MGHTSETIKNKNEQIEHKKSSSRVGMEHFVLDGNKSLPDINIHIPKDGDLVIYANKKNGLFGLYPEGTNLLSKPPKQYSQLNTEAVSKDIKQKTNESFPLVALATNGIVYRTPDTSGMAMVYIDGNTDQAVNLSAGDTPTTRELVPEYGDRLYVVNSAAAEMLLAGSDEADVLDSVIQEGSPYMSVVFETDVVTTMQDANQKSQSIEQTKEQTEEQSEADTPQNLDIPATAPEQSPNPLLSMGLKQLAKEVADNKVSGDGSLELWALDNVVIPRASAEAGIDDYSKKSVEEQRNEQIAIFQSDVQYFVDKRVGAVADELKSEGVVITQDTNPLPEKSRKKTVKNLLNRLKDFRSNRKEQRKPTPEIAEISSQDTSRALGIEAFMGMVVSSTSSDVAERNDKFNDRAKDWHDIFQHTALPEAEQYHILQIIGPILRNKGYVRGGSIGRWDINQLNPPSITYTLKLIENVIAGRSITSVPEDEEAFYGTPPIGTTK